MRALERCEARPVAVEERRPYRAPVSEGREAAVVKRAAPCRSRKVLVRFLLFAVASAAMYGLFFGSMDRLFPMLTAGTAVSAVLVIVLALTFCLVHGTCANYLLELLGIRELKK